MGESITVRESHGIVNFDETAMSAAMVLKQVKIIQDIMKEVMHKDEHFGIIPGTEKPSLLKPGAEKLGLTFRLAPEYDVTVVDLPREHREYRIKCRLFHIPTGLMVGEGVGTCSTTESKWRYISDVEWTGKPVPKDYWDKRDVGLIGGKGFVAKKNQSNQWEIAKIAGKVERENPADYYNTCEKMGKKRAHVDAILTATAASDIFTQDVEEIVENEAEGGKNQGSGTPPNDKKSVRDTLFEELRAYCNDNEAAMATVLKAVTIFQGDKRDKDGNVVGKKDVWMTVAQIGKQETKEAWLGKVLGKLREYIKAHPKVEAAPEIDGCTKSVETCPHIVFDDDKPVCAAVADGQCKYV